METEYTMPVTGGFFSTDLIIVIAVAIAFVLLYIVFCMIRENKKSGTGEFSKDDFVTDEQEKNRMF